MPPFTPRPPAQIYLLRHGETEWNAAGRFQGHLDSPLTARGVKQAQAAGRRLAALAVAPGAFFASPLGRARHTAEVVRSLGDYPTIRWDSRLAEVSLGCWDGLTPVDIDAEWPRALDGASPFDWYFRSPDGESHDEAAARVAEWLAEVEGVVVAVTHGLLSRIIRGLYLGLPREHALELPVGQDGIWLLSEGEVTSLAT